MATAKASRRLSRQLLAFGLVLAPLAIVAFVMGSALAMTRAMEDLKLRHDHTPVGSKIPEAVPGAMVDFGEIGFALGCVVTLIAVIRLVREAPRNQIQRPLSTTPPPSP